MKGLVNACRIASAASVALVVVVPAVSVVCVHAQMMCATKPVGNAFANLPVNIEVACIRQHDSSLISNVIHCRMWL